MESSRFPHSNPANKRPNIKTPYNPISFKYNVKKLRAQMSLHYSHTKKKKKKNYFVVTKQIPSVLSIR